ncbi:MAG: CapA family protein [Candidatus Hermodarchaeota archaeon]
MIKTRKNGTLGKKSLFGSPYPLKENFGWFKRLICGPSTNNSGNVHYLSKSTVLNKITPKYTISFIGDIMDLNLRDLVISDNVKHFIEGSDFLIGNFEATLTSEKKLINSKRHKPQIMDALASVFNPKKTYLSTANNHSADFGETNFSESVTQLKKRGFNVFGTEKNPFVDLAEDLRVIGCTQWSNHPCDYLVSIEDSSQYLKDDTFNLLFPHWGYEMELYPRMETIKQGKELLNKFDAIIGHHSHNPQPVSFFPFDSDNKLIVYSLGDFCDGKEFEMHNYGILLKIEIGTDAKGRWLIGKCEWTFLKTLSVSETEFIVDIADNFSDFVFNYKSLYKNDKVEEILYESSIEMEQVVVCV